MAEAVDEASSVSSLPEPRRRPAPGGVFASKSNKSGMNIELHETVTDVVDGLGLRTQAAVDQAKLFKFVPRDQVRRFEARWDGPTLRFTELAPEPAKTADGKPEDVGELSRIAAMSVEDAQTEAAERGVKWDGRASRDTMNRKIAAARQPAGAVA